MEYYERLLQDVKRLMVTRYPRFAQEIANANLQFRTDLPYHTAATDGKNIYFDPNYLESLSDNDKLFIIAHELMHVKFEHMFRMTDKNGKMRDSHIWNIATDAIINANLERDGFKIKEGYVNMPEALNYNAEEFYEKLLKEKQEEQQQQSDNGQDQDGQQNGQNGQGNSQNGQQQQSQQGQEQDDVKGEQFADDHSLWEKAFEENNKKEQTQNKNQKQSSQSKNSSADQTSHSNEKFDVKADSNKDNKEYEAKFNEKSEFQENREERRERARRNIERMRDQELKKSESGNIEFGDVGQAKPILDWKLLLRREVDKTETIWSQRKSIAENNYAYRLEENDVEDEAETEVMIDVSGSVSNEMVRSFLRQLKPILKNSKLKVGFFADYATKEFQEIKCDRDINCLKIYRPGMGTNMDAAVRAFSKKHEVNKIVFTDGYPGKEPKNDLKNVNVIWLVYENREFHPCCGKVIDVYPKDFQNDINIIDDEECPIN